MFQIFRVTIKYSSSMNFACFYFFNVTTEIFKITYGPPIRFSLAGPALGRVSSGSVYQWDLVEATSCLILTPHL